MTEDKKVAVNPEPQKSGSGKKPVSSTGPQGVLQRSSIEPKAKNSHFYLLISFFIVFLIPSIICVSYYSFVASDRYAAGAGFVVRGLKNSGPSDLISSFTGLTSAGSTTSDSYVIKKFIESPDLVRELDEELDLRAHYSNPSIDWVSRFNNQLSFEEFVEYWKWRSTTTYDSSTGIVSFEVQAFDPQMAKRLADAILALTTKLVNGLSEQARNDSLAFIALEVDLAEERLRKVQQRIRDFRSRNGSIDPALNSELDAKLISSIESELSGVRARISALSKEVSSSSPIIRQLKNKESALIQQIKKHRKAIGDSGGRAGATPTASVIAEFESLQIEQTFAQQRYSSALTSLESARMEADRKQRYLAVYSRPFVPEEALYPERIRNALLGTILFFVFWVIGTLITLAVRDHLR